MSSMKDPDSLLRTIRGINHTVWSKDTIPLATHASMTSSTWNFGLISSLENPILRNQIEDLSRRQETPNPFFELPVLEPSTHYLQNEMMQYLYLSERVGSNESLKLFSPVRLEKSMILRRPIIRIWSHKYAPLGYPLIDKRQSELTYDALVSCLKSPNSSQPAAFLFDDIMKDSSLYKYLEKSPHLADSFYSFADYERAALFPVLGKTYDEVHVSGKRRQRLKSAMKKLGKHTDVAFKRYTSKEMIMPALEKLLALEAEGWKGNQGTALLNDNDAALCTRENVANMADKNQCEIFALESTNKTLASVIVYNSNGFYFPWKTAFDEDYEKYSVGNILMNHLNQVLSEDDNFRGLDSLAAADNKTALRIWPDRLNFCSLVIGMGDGGNILSQKIASEAQFQAKSKAFLKRLLKR